MLSLPSSQEKNSSSESAAFWPESYAVLSSSKLPACTGDLARDADAARDRGLRDPDLVRLFGCAVLPGLADLPCSDAWPLPAAAESLGGGTEDPPSASSLVAGGATAATSSISCVYVRSDTYTCSEGSEPSNLPRAYIGLSCWMHW